MRMAHSVADWNPNPDSSHITDRRLVRLRDLWEIVRVERDLAVQRERAERRCDRIDLTECALLATPQPQVNWHTRVLRGNPNQPTKAQMSVWFPRREDVARWRQWSGRRCNRARRVTARAHESWVSRPRGKAQAGTTQSGANVDGAVPVPVQTCKGEPPGGRTST